MGTIFKYDGKLIQCQNLQKKLKKLHLSESNIEIIKDGIPNDILEKEFVSLTKSITIDDNCDVKWDIFVYRNSKGYYLNCVNNPSLEQYSRFGYDVSDYKLIDHYKGFILSKYNKYNPEIGIGDKRYN